MLLKREREEKGEPVRRIDPRIKRTRQLLQQAFMDLMREKSFQAITVQNITERATVNRATFYAHFKNKFALLEFTLREMISQCLRSQLPEGSPASSKNLACLILAICEFLAEVESRYPPLQGQLGLLMERQIKAELYEVLLDWLAERPPDESKRDPTPEQAAMIASWAIYGAVVHWHHQEQREPAGEYLQQVLPLILGSLQPLAEFPAS